MAVENPGAFNENYVTGYNAEQLRRAFGSLLQRGATVGSITGGLVAVGDMLLSPPGSGMTVTVAAGEAWVPGSSSASQSGYYTRVSSSTSLAVAASDPSNPRIDRVSAVVTDSSYSGGTDTFAVVVSTGTPTAGATLVNLNGVAAAPASSLTLGYVLVPAASTNVTGPNISSTAQPFSSGAAAPLRVVDVSSTTSASGGHVYVCTGTFTVTLPAPTANATVGVYCNSGTITVAVSTGTIFGLGLNGASSFLLGEPGANVLLEADGSNWFIVSGQQDTGWAALTLGSNLTATGAPWYSPQCRVIGDRAFLRGTVHYSGASSTTITASAAAHPASAIGLLLGDYTAGNAVLPCQMTTSGVVTFSPATNHDYLLDGISYPIV